MEQEFKDQHCVRCGRLVDRLEVEALDYVGMPACCEHCHPIVWEENDRGGDGWPSGWHGKAYREKASGRWLYS